VLRKELPLSRVQGKGAELFTRCPMPAVRVLRLLRRDSDRQGSTRFDQLAYYRLPLLGTTVLYLLSVLFHSAKTYRLRTLQIPNLSAKKISNLSQVQNGPGYPDRWRACTSWLPRASLVVFLVSGGRLLASTP
jgi:hypothetical protein